MNIDKTIELAFEHHQQGNLKRAEYLYKKILKKQPDNTAVLHMLGVIHSEYGNYELAIKYIKKVLQLNSADYHAYYNLGNAFRLNGQSEEAIESYRKVIYSNPYFADAYQNLGIVYQGRGEVDEAISCFQKVIQISPDFSPAYINLANIFRDRGQFDEAMACYQKAIELNPNNAEAYCNLGFIYQNQGKLDEAMVCYQKGNLRDPDIAEVYCNIGIILQTKGKLDEARTFYQRALQINENDALAHLNVSVILLLYGNFKEGWREHEWRLKLKHLVEREFSQPLWDGSDIKGRTILLYTEQGFGDAIHFVRYTPLVAKSGAKIIIGCQKELTSLFQNVKGIQQVIAQGEQLPPFDVHCSFMSLPVVFGTTLDTIPGDIPYLKADTALLQKWKDKVKDDDSKLRVGLSWAGRPEHRNDSNRSFTLETLAPIAQSDEVIFYSLQKGKGSEQTKNPPEGMKLVDYTEEIRDFSDTAALIENLDLVISVDTAVAHLAGAVGKPVWTLLPFVPDWRWLLNREDSPWYPTMRLFRQPSPGDWQSVINRVLRALEIYLRNENR
jgi:tetratricopeptide (TPR) repeat protein